MVQKLAQQLRREPKLNGLHFLSDDLSDTIAIVGDDFVLGFVCDSTPIYLHINSTPRPKVIPVDGYNELVSQLDYWYRQKCIHTNNRPAKPDDCKDWIVFSNKFPYLSKKITLNQCIYEMRLLDNEESIKDNLRKGVPGEAGAVFDIWEDAARTAHIADVLNNMSLTE